MITGMRVRRRGSAGGVKGYKFYRLVVYDRAPFGSSIALSLGELQIVTNHTPTGVPVNGTATASIGTAANAFDGDLSTRWNFTISSSPFPQWIQYEFPSRQEASLYRLGIGTGRASMPGIWDFLGSNDGLVWVTLDSQSGIVYSVSESYRDFPLA